MDPLQFGQLSDKSPAETLIQARYVETRNSQLRCSGHRQYRDDIQLSFTPVRTPTEFTLIERLDISAIQFCVSGLC